MLSGRKTPVGNCCVEVKVVKMLAVTCFFFFFARTLSFLNTQIIQISLLFHLEAFHEILEQLQKDLGFSLFVAVISNGSGNHGRRDRRDSHSAFHCAFSDYAVSSV